MSFKTDMAQPCEIQKEEALNKTSTFENVEKANLVIEPYNSSKLTSTKYSSSNIQKKENLLVQSLLDLES